MAAPSFDKSVFINAPFDVEYEPILQAIAFCVIYLGFFPRLAPENSDNSAARLDRIVELVRGSKFGIHDLSRCKATVAGEYARMNMPFELGIDFACRKIGTAPLDAKTILILEHTRYDHKQALSDTAGWDIEVHGGDYVTAVRHVSRWLIARTGVGAVGASRIQDRYSDFQGWYWERESAFGSSPDDIRAYPTVHVVQAMLDWMTLGRPLTV